MNRQRFVTRSSNLCFWIVLLLFSGKLFAAGLLVPVDGSIAAMEIASHRVEV